MLITARFFTYLTTKASLHYCFNNILVACLLSGLFSFHVHAEPYVAIPEEKAFKAGKIQAVVLATFNSTTQDGHVHPTGHFLVDKLLWKKHGAPPKVLNLRVDLGSGCEPPPSSKEVDKALGKGSKWILFLSFDAQTGYYLDYQLTHRGRLRASSSNLEIVKNFLEPGSRSNLTGLQ